MRNRDIPCEQYVREMTRRSLGAAWTLALLVLVGSGNAAKAIHKKCHYEKLNCLYRCGVARDLGKLSDHIWRACNIKCANDIKCESYCFTRLSCGGLAAP
jgi:hypothetical protein